ncbi:MAG: class I SAM-dependent methyltransferase [Chloroflexota bacterium]
MSAAALVILAGVALAGIAFLVWWLVFESEGVYLGRRAVIWLYELYAWRYDRIKAFTPEYDHLLLAQPIMGAIAPHRAPMVLDVATGTGRLPDAVLNHTLFQGRVIGVDASRRMLVKAAAKLAADGDRVTLVWADALDLPFLDESFDVVTCLEALEFMPDQMRALDELLRVLRPGGLLLITQRINTRWMPGRLHDGAALETLLTARGAESVTLEPWQEDYNRVWARKQGMAPAIGARPVAEILRCPDGGRLDAVGQCDGAEVPIADDGVIEWLRLK